MTVPPPPPLLGAGPRPGLSWSKAAVALCWRAPDFAALMHARYVQHLVFSLQHDPILHAAQIYTLTTVDVNL